MVDDDAEVRDAICDVLLDEGYRVARAGNGAEAMALLASGRRPGLIVLDLTMPVMDGHEFLERRARDARLPDIPVIVVSAGVDRTTSRFEALGVGFVRKPIDLETLLAAIHGARRLR